MSSFRLDPAVAADAAAVAEVIVALESSLYGQTTFSQADLEDEWSDGLRVVPFDPEHDALEFHAAHQEAFADHWDYTPRAFESWSESHLASERFDPTLWCVVRAGDEIAAGTICTGDTYGGGWVHVLFTRRPWRKQGVGTALLGDSFGRFWERGEHSVGLSVDAANDTGAFRLYERAGMRPVLGWVVYEKRLGDGA